MGVPSFGIMISKSVRAARLMSKLLGAGNYLFITINHPISNATKYELKIQAGNSLKEGINFLLKSERSIEL